MTLDDLIEERNEIQFLSEGHSEDEAIECWTRLGVANRHIERVVTGVLPLTPAIELEIAECFQRVREWQKGKQDATPSLAEQAKSS